MTTAAGGPLNQIPFEVPDLPHEFGQDGGRFYRLYDNLAEEIDDDMAKGLKEQLDGLLIFAGLFAGVNSAFLALTLPLLSADPADDTNALLAQNNAILMQLMQGRNDTSLGNSTLPSTSFSPSHGIFTVNVLFSFSLALAIISSFLAVLGRQWLVYYRKRSGGGPDSQRWEQLKRFLGASRWRLELVLDDILPSLLQIGLIIFCVSLILYLHVLNPSISRIVGIPMCLGLAIFVLGALFTVWDRFCPFQSPLSHLFCWFTSRFLGQILPLVLPKLWHLILWYPTHLIFSFAPIGRMLSKLWRQTKPLRHALWLTVWFALGFLAFYVAILLIPVWLPFIGFAYLIGLPVSSKFDDVVSSFINFVDDSGRRGYYTSLSDRLRTSLKRLFRTLFRGYFTMLALRGPKNEVAFLQVVALKRAICTSDDPLTLLCATANIFTIDDTRYLEGLWSDEMFHSRFLELCTNPYQRMVQLLGRDRIKDAISAARLYRGAMCHIFLSLDPADQHWRLLYGEVPQDIVKAIMSEPLVDSSWLIPLDMVGGCSPALIEAALASWMLRACVEYVPVERIGSHLTEYSDSLSISSWKLVSLIVYILTRFPYSAEWTKIIQDGSQPFHSSPKRYDTMGSVITTGPPFFTGQPFTQPILTGQPGIRVVHNQQIIHPTGVPIYPQQTGIHISPRQTGAPISPQQTGASIYPQPTGVPIFHIQAIGHPDGSPIYATSTSHPNQQIIVVQRTGILPAPVIQGQITGGPPQPIVSEGSVGDRLYMEGTGQTAPLPHVTGPIPPMPTGVAGVIFRPRIVLPQETPTGQQVSGGVPIQILPPHEIQPTFAVQPVLNTFRPSRSYTYPVHEVSCDVNDMLTRSLDPVLNIEQLRSAYTRDVGMTLIALEEVAIDLARQRYAGNLDCHRILLNILGCAGGIMNDASRYPKTGVRDKLGLLDIAEQVLRIEDISVEIRDKATTVRMDCVTMLQKIIIDDSRYPDTRVKDKFRLLDTAEQLLRIEDIPVQVRATATMLRIDFVTMLRLRFMTGDARRKIPSDLLVLLRNFFFKLRARGDSSQLTNEEDLLVLQLFEPLLRELYSYPTNVWKINDRNFWGSPTARLKNLCDDLRQVYHQFRAKVDRAFRAFQSDGQCNRDPEISWCHWRDELDRDLPAQHFSEQDPSSVRRSRFLDESALVDDDSARMRPASPAYSRVSSPSPAPIRILQGISPASSDDGRYLVSSPINIPIWMTASPLQGVVEEDSPPPPIQPSLPLVVDSPPQLSEDGQSLASESHGTVDRTV